MKGKAIYTPSGKAGEYSYWAVNFYNGCSANCDYCYCKKGVLSSLWSTTPTLKKSLETHGKAIEIFKKEVRNNIHALREHGLFFNFTSDPFLKETIDLNLEAMRFCNGISVPVKALTKQTWWIEEFCLPKNVTIGFTITGMGGMEKGASSTDDRIKALEKFKKLKYKTWVSVEPVIDIIEAWNIIKRCSYYADHFKIGPLSGKNFTKDEVEEFIETVNYWIDSTPIYWKEGFIEKMGIIRDSLPENCVNRDYKWWSIK